MQLNASGTVATMDSSLMNPLSPKPASREKSLFQQILTEVNNQQNQADSQVQRSLLGEGDLHEATIALEKADLSLRLLVQVRNKLVSAYEELSRMPM
jgi:flagellar hook-basal body complex protein FliE|uniref:Flagellar hook-basal body complex protein FliE n=1 Tax=Desulfobacca acetoxidans TaxID=60893 RepID=A0A7V6A2R1_9BACT